MALSLFHICQTLIIGHLLLQYTSSVVGADAVADPCAKITGLSFVSTADAIACQKSFPFNETLRQNVISVISGVFDFYTFEDYYLDSPPPFQESTSNIRAQIARINNTDYEVSQYVQSSNSYLLSIRSLRPLDRFRL